MVEEGVRLGRLVEVGWAGSLVEGLPLLEEEVVGEKIQGAVEVRLGRLAEVGAVMVVQWGAVEEGWAALLEVEVIGLEREVEEVLVEEVVVVGH
jgi:hypothetical protein